MNNNRNNNRRRGRGNNRNQGGANSGNRIDSRARGNAPQLLDKYKKLAQDAQHNGDRVQAEYYLQFADHYFRVIADNKARQDEAKAKRHDERGHNQSDDDDDDDDGDDRRNNRRPRGRRDDQDDDNRKPRARRDDRDDDEDEVRQPRARRSENEDDGARKPRGRKPRNDDGVMAKASSSLPKIRSHAATKRAKHPRSVAHRASPRQAIARREAMAVSMPPCCRHRSARTIPMKSPHRAAVGASRKTTAK